MAENLSPNQNPKPVQTRAPFGAGPNVPVNPGTPKIFLAVVAIALLLVLLAVFYAKGRKPSKLEEKETPSLPPLASVVPNASPYQLPKVQEEDKKAKMREFFKTASPVNFKEKFLEQVPQAAADAFIKFSTSTSVEDRKEAARSFYIILKGPNADRSDPAFGPFSADVYAALEKEAGPLF